MRKNKRGGDYWLIVSKDGMRQLDTYNAQTIEECRVRIDESNAREVAHGYMPETWIISYHEWEVTKTDDGVFDRRNELTYAVEMYGAGVQKKLMEV